MGNVHRLTAALAGVSSLLLTSTYASAALVDRYSFNDGTANDSLGTANGTVMGNATVANGLLTTTGSNTATNNVTLPSTTAAGVTGDFTIEDFVTQVGTGTSYATLFSLSNSQSQFLLANADRPGSNVLSVDFDPDPASTNEIDIVGTAPLTVGTEADLAITYTAASGTATVYVNGAQVGTGTVPGFVLSTVAGGAFDGINGNGPFTGDPDASASTDDFRIYNAALTPGQVAFVAAAGPNAVPEPASLGLIGLGALGLVGRRTRRA